MSSQIKGIDFDQSYSPVEHADLFIINIDISDMHRLIASILDVSNAFQNKNLPLIKEFVSVHHLIISTGLKVERSYPNVPLNKDNCPFFLHCMNGIKGKKPDVRQRNRLLD